MDNVDPNTQDAHLRGWLLDEFNFTPELFGWQFPNWQIGSDSIGEHVFVDEWQDLFRSLSSQARADFEGGNSTLKGLHPNRPSIRFCKLVSWMSVKVEYIAASTNRHSCAADSASNSLVAFGSSTYVALWNAEVRQWFLCIVIDTEGPVFK